MADHGIQISTEQNENRDALDTMTIKRRLSGIEEMSHRCRTIPANDKFQVYRNGVEMFGITTLGPEFRKTHTMEGEAVKINYKECIGNETFQSSN